MDEVSLNNLYKDMEYSGDELARNREVFLQNLSESDSKQSVAARSIAVQMDRSSSVESFRSYWFRSPALWSALVASVCTLFIGMMFFRADPLDGHSLDEIQEFVASNGNYSELFSLAEKMQRSTSDVTRLNGLLVESLLGNGAESRLASAEGLVQDPRNEYRIYYLEYLLENANEDYYNAAYIEQLIEQEENEECLYLLEKLLLLARLNGEPAFI